jgi:EAL domain-containing protein (putative c-di-GMP-specific phosphodiesterase class I)
LRSCMQKSLLLLAKAVSEEPVKLALASIRKHLGMEVAYISEFVGNDSVFREVDAPGLEALIKVGDVRSLEDVYCRHILEGRLPELMADTGDYELARRMPITSAVPIGAHMSVPINGKDGVPVGMFCCLSPNPNKTLNDRDLQVMRVFADMAANQIADRMEREREARDRNARIEEVLAKESFNLVYQPICQFNLLRPTGLEVLCRFAGEPYRSPDQWFNEAFQSGHGVALELAVMSKALQAFRHLPEDIYLSLNASPETILSGELPASLNNAPQDRLVLEITEHAPVADYAALEAALAPLRKGGVRIAVDDAGAGYSGLQHVLSLSPDIIKLDMSLTRDIDTDQARQALASALIYFATKTGCVIIAEGVETQAELDTLKLLGVPRGQGYYLGKPLGLPATQSLFGSSERLASA